MIATATDNITISFMSSVAANCFFSIFFPSFLPQFFAFIHQSLNYIKHALRISQANVPFSKFLSFRARTGFNSLFLVNPKPKKVH